MKIITFLTDFGTNNGYFPQMKGVALGITDARLVNITQEIAPHNIREGAFVLQTVVPYFPVGTVHVAVVDPGVGTKRKGIVITAKSHILIGPDNGLLMPTAHLLGDFTVYEITTEKYMLKNTSNTFHGRDIFTPIAAHITNGIHFEEIGNKTNDYVDLDFGQGKINNKTANGKVIYIDSFGNIVTNISGFELHELLQYDKKIMVFIGNKSKEMSFVKSYGFVRKGQILATVGSSNLFEIGINQGNAAKKLSVKEGDEIKILFG